MVLSFCSLPHRQLRNIEPLFTSDLARSLPHRQLRKITATSRPQPPRSLPHRQLRKMAMAGVEAVTMFTAA